MAKITFQSIIQYEFDTETEKTRVIKAFTTPMKDTKIVKKKPKQLKPMTTKQLEDEYL